MALLETDATRWKPIYNLGWNEKRYNIMQLAEITAQVAKEYGFGEVTISLEKRHKAICWDGFILVFA